MIQIFHSPNTRGVRPIWACEELGLEYQVVPVDFSPEYRATEEWRAMNPTGKVPVLRDGDVTMFESGAMVQYLLDTYGNGRLAPAVSDSEYPIYLQWFWFSEATLSRPLGEVVNHGREFPGDKAIPEVLAEMRQRGVVCVEAVAAYMEGRTFLVNETFSAADIMMGYGLLLCDMLIPGKMPDTLLPYWQSLQERPGFKRAIAA